MGLAQLMERPRNWQLPCNNMTDTLSQIEDGVFGGFQGFTNLNPNENQRRHNYPYDLVIERLFVVIVSNGLTGGSVNTLTLRVDGSDTTHIITLTDASAINVILSITGLAQAVSAGQAVSVRWNSNSAGTMSLRLLGMSYRIVNPAA